MTVTVAGRSALASWYQRELQDYSPADLKIVSEENAPGELEASLGWLSKACGDSRTVIIDSHLELEEWARPEYLPSGMPFGLALALRILQETEPPWIESEVIILCPYDPKKARDFVMAGRSDGRHHDDLWKCIEAFDTTQSVKWIAPISSRGSASVAPPGERIGLAQDILEALFEAHSHDIRHQLKNQMAAVRLLLGAIQEGTVKGDVDGMLKHFAPGVDKVFDKKLLQRYHNALRGKEHQANQTPGGARGVGLELGGERTWGIHEGRVRLLLIDDEADTAGWRHLFKIPGFVPFTKVDVTSASADVAKQHLLNEPKWITKFDLILVDYWVKAATTSDGEGLDVIDLLRQRDPLVPCMLFTASNNPALHSKAIALGATSYFVKELRGFDRSSLRYYRALREQFDALGPLLSTPPFLSSSAVPKNDLSESWLRRLRRVYQLTQQCEPNADISQIAARRKLIRKILFYCTQALGYPEYLSEVRASEGEGAWRVAATYMYSFCEMQLKLTAPGRICDNDGVQEMLQISGKGAKAIIEAKHGVLQKSLPYWVYVGLNSIANWMTTSWKCSAAVAVQATTHPRYVESDFSTKSHLDRNEVALGALLLGGVLSWLKEPDAPREALLKTRRLIESRDLPSAIASLPRRSSLSTDKVKVAFLDDILKRVPFHVALEKLIPELSIAAVSSPGDFARAEDLDAVRNAGLILLDLAIPLPPATEPSLANGLKVLRGLRRLQSTQIVVFSAAQDISVWRSAINAGANGIRRKVDVSGADDEFCQHYFEDFRQIFPSDSKNSLRAVLEALLEKSHNCRNAFEMFVQGDEELTLLSDILSAVHSCLIRVHSSNTDALYRRLQLGDFNGHEAALILFFVFVEAIYRGKRLASLHKMGRKKGFLELHDALPSPLKRRLEEVTVQEQAWYEANGAPTDLVRFFANTRNALVHDGNAIPSSIRFPTHISLFFRHLKLAEAWLKKYYPIS